MENVNRIQRIQVRDGGCGELQQFGGLRESGPAEITI